MSDQTDFNDKARVAGLDAVKADVDRVLASAAAAVAPGPMPGEAASGPVADEWPVLVLPDSMKVPDIPVALLPDWMAAMAGAVSKSSQTPPAMAVMAGLSVLATVFQRRFEVAPKGIGNSYTEPLSLWTLSAMPSGSRKSTVFSSMNAPLLEWENLERERGRSDRIRVESMRLVAAKRIESLLSNAGKAKSAEERERITAEIQREKEMMPNKLISPRLLTEDITAETLQTMLGEHAERIAVLSDEGGKFDRMAGLYSCGTPNLDVYLKGHTGSALRVDRADRHAHLDKPAISVGLTVQPDVFDDAGRHRRFRASGLLARFLYAMPESNVGRRNVRQLDTVPDQVINDYQANIFRLLPAVPVVACRPRVLPMDQAAYELWADFSQEIEDQQGDGRLFESITDWTSKLPGAVARIAALFALADTGPDVEEVGEVATWRAIQIGRLLIPHAQSALGMLGLDAVDGDCLAILKWIQAQELTEFNKRDCQRALSGRFRDGARMGKAIARLVEQGAVRSLTKKNKGARSSEIVEVNPTLCRDFTFVTRK